MVSTLLQDLTFAVRQFRRSPGFALTAVLTLALGIGSTTAIFSLFDGILLRPLPFPHADQLVAIDTLEFPPGVGPTNLAAAWGLGSSYPNYFDWRRQNQSFESLASYDHIYRLFSKANGEGARVLEGGRISANLFSTLGVAPALGRSFTEDEQQPGHRVAILSHALWVSDFAASPSAIGQTVKISDEPYTIVGVMPASFHYPVGKPCFFWSTYSIDAEGRAPGTSLRDSDNLSIVGRLKFGIGIKQALAELNTIQRGLAQQYSEDRYRLGVSINPLLEEEVSDIRPALSLLLAAVGVVLIIACANVAGLLLARANGRRSELALRTALGASRIRVVGNCWSKRYSLPAPAEPPASSPRSRSSALECGSSPAICPGCITSPSMAACSRSQPCFRPAPHSSSDCSRRGECRSPTQPLPCETAALPPRRAASTPLHHALIVAQTALGFTLLIGSGLLIQSMFNVIHINPGFDTTHTAYFDIALTNKLYPVPAKFHFIDKLLPEIASLPGVERVSAGHPLPILWGPGTFTNFTIANHLNSPDHLPDAGAAIVMPGYFETLSIPLVRGRTIAPHDDDPKATLVAVINQAFARKYFPNEDPLGQYFTPKFDIRTNRSSRGRSSESLATPGSMTCGIPTSRSSSCPMPRIPVTNARSS